jgi:hypothetical protein
MVYKLGKLPKRIDIRNLKFAKYLKTLPPIPKKLDWTKGIIDWGMMLNDQLGCCTCATAGHMIQGWTVNDSIMKSIPDIDILEAYKNISGYNGSPSTDQGAYVLDVLKYWRKYGIGGHKIDVFVEIDPTDLQMIKTAIYLFGAVYYGIELPRSFENQKVWDVPWYGARWNGRKGSAGGHAVSCHGYNENFTLITWGKLQQMTSRFATTYASEAYAVLSIEDWTGIDRKAPNMFDVETLMEDLKGVAR